MYERASTSQGLCEHYGAWDLVKEFIVKDSEATKLNSDSGKSTTVTQKVIPHDSFYLQWMLSDQKGAQWSSVSV